MFKNSLLLITVTLFFGISFNSCTKTEDKDVFVEPYIVQGIADLELKKGFQGYAYAQLPILIDYKNSKQEKVSLSLEGVPPGISYTVTPTSGYAPFNAFITLYDTAATAGDYTLRLKTQTASTDERTFDFNLKVWPTPDCVEALIGTYNTGGSGCYPFYSYTSNITRKSPGSSAIVFENFLNTALNLEGIVSCKNASITIEKQTFTYSNVNYEISGSGYYSTISGITISNISLNLLLKNLSNNYTSSCNLSLFR